MLRPEGFRMEGSLGVVTSSGLRNPSLWGFTRQKSGCGLTLPWWQDRQFGGLTKMGSQYETEVSAGAVDLKVSIGDTTTQFQFMFLAMGGIFTDSSFLPIGKFMGLQWRGLEGKVLRDLSLGYA